MSNEKRERALVRWSESPAFISGGRFDCFRAGYDACAADNAGDMSLHTFDKDMDGSMEFNETGQGDWVRREDAEKALAKAEARIAELEEELQEARWSAMGEDL